jgi:hypothetical protein
VWPAAVVAVAVQVEEVAGSLLQAVQAKYLLDKLVKTDKTNQPTVVVVVEVVATAATAAL